MRLSLLILLGSLFWIGCTGPQLYPELGPDTKILVRKWTISTHGPFEIGDHGTEYSNPVLFENTLVFGNRSTGIKAIYPGINQPRWSFSVKEGVVSELAVDKKSVYFGGADGHLYSVNLENGRVNWDYDLRNPFISRPTVERGRLLVTTSDDTVYAFDANTGKWLWHYRRRSVPTSKIYGASSPLVEGNTVFAGLSDGFLVALSLEEGQLKWERKIHQGTKFTDVNAHPILENGIIYIPSYDGALYALKHDTGEIIWRFDAGGSKNVVIEDQKIYFPSSDGTIYCLQKDNAKLLWKFELDQGTPTQVVASEKYLMMGSSYQYFYALDKTTGKGVYRFNAGRGSGFAGSPLFDPASQSVYILSGAGNLYKFALRQPPRKFHPHGITDPYIFFQAP